LKQETLKEVDEIMGKIEIVNEEGELQILHFPKTKSITEIWELELIQDYKSILIRQISRDNSEEKVHTI
jgi:hypothetical protein